ncbi:MAG: hypothetical protein WC584_05350 [Candidatus Pacearchaeota archaeon]
MVISAKEILIILIGIVGSAIIGLIIRILNFNSSSLSFMGWILMIVIAVSLLIVLMYKRLNEINEDLDKQKENYNKLDERLKIYKMFVNLEARIVALENKNG